MRTQRDKYARQVEDAEAVQLYNFKLKYQIMKLEEQVDKLTEELRQANEVIRRITL